MTTNDAPNSELILYRTADDAVRVEVLYESEAFWLDQRRMAELFGVDVRTVSYHLKEGYASGELSPEATLRRIWRVQRAGGRKVRRAIDCQDRVGESDFAAHLERTESKRPKNASPIGEQKP